MPQVVSADPGLADRLTVEVDPSADPVDWDQAVARFLLAFVRKQSRSSPGSPAAAVEFQQAPEAERQDQWT
jgi:hypothetical protein